MPREIYIGLMSGTSVDAIDAALVEFLEDRKINLLATHSQPMPKQLKQDILTLCQQDNPQGIHLLGKVDIELGNMFSRCVLELLKKSKTQPMDVIAIGSHGQTICHMPTGEFPFTIQIGDPNIITKVTGITTVADFRRRDMAYGGQAAPLAPAFHQHLFQNEEQSRFIVNIGGIANLTFLPKNKETPVIGFDTGPGNTLLDNLSQTHLQKPYDQDGQWAATGTINQALLDLLLDDAYFKQPPPKSTGREHFNPQWLQKQCQQLATPLPPEDLQATATELTAKSIAQAILATQEAPADVFLCGGGAYNTHLLKRIQAHLPKHHVTTSADIGLAPQWVEAVTFAWLAKRTMHYQPGNLPSVTGATRHTILGAIYPASTH